MALATFNARFSMVVSAQENPVRINLSDLYVDAENPRRSIAEVDLDQRALVEELYQRYDISDLLASLCNNGYFSEEPLIAIPRDVDEAGQQTYTVVEGNRRLAALKILMDDDFQGIANPRLIPEIPDSVRPTLDPVPVKIYATRDEVMPYLGVRHIAGTKPWDALAKATYVARLVEAGESYVTVARRIGSGRRTDVVRKWLLTLYAMNQANENAEIEWEIADQGFGFSWLYTSIGYRSVRDYIGVSQETYNNPHSSPVPEEYHNKLHSHMHDLYGPPPGNSRQAAIKESRQISQLAKIYANEDALGALRAGANLSEALAKTLDETDQLIQSLLRADINLASAISLAPNHKGDDEAIRYARRCYNTSEALVDTLSD